MATTYRSVEEQGAVVQVSATPNQCYLKFIGCFAVSAILNDLLLLPIITILIFYELAMRGMIDIESTWDICDCEAPNDDQIYFCEGPYCECSHYDRDSDLDVSIWAMAWGYDFGAICLAVLGILLTICATSWSVPEVFAAFLAFRMHKVVYFVTLVLRLIGVICAAIFIAAYPPTHCSCDSPCTVDMTFDWNRYVDTLGVLMRLYIACGVFFLCTKRILLCLIRNVKMDVSMEYLKWHYIKIEQV